MTPPPAGRRGRAPDDDGEPAQPAGATAPGVQLGSITVSLGQTNSLVRWAAKVLLVDQQDRVLLFRGWDPARPAGGFWWMAPGGGVDEGETPDECARREVLEETGLVLTEIGPIVHHRTAEFSFGGRAFVAEEDYFVVRVEHFEINTNGWTELEREVMVEHRWWPIGEIEITNDVVYPENVVDLCRRFGG